MGNLCIVSIYRIRNGDYNNHKYENDTTRRVKMSALTKVLEDDIVRVENEKKDNISKDRFRLGYHLMPPVGWLNDPNGLCWFKGKYHVFFQYSPHSAQGGLKYWGHYTSTDLIHWEYEGVPLVPDSSYDCHGVYSGSAFVENEKMHLFYTGNVKREGNYDYITDGRGHNTMYAVSEDGKYIHDKLCLMTNRDYPEHCTCHVRDPKVWKEGETYYMVQGARTKQDMGEVLLFCSDDLKKWKLQNVITSDPPFGYMWECPDYFEVEECRILSVSPQGLEAKEYCWQNLYQSGYFKVQGDIRSEYRLGEFTEWDMGFDFYAPQTFEDYKGRRILIAWMGMPDIRGIYENPTENTGWQHILTVPRELTVKNNKVFQWPVQELESLRKNPVSISSDETCMIASGMFDLVSEISEGAKSYQVQIGKDVEFTWNKETAQLSFHGEEGAGRKIRKAKIKNLNQVRILGDTSALEIYLNEGEMVFSTRYYPVKKEAEIIIQSQNADTVVWEMNGFSQK